MTFEDKLNETFDEGFERGIDQGRDLERTETIASMIANGFDDNQILSVYKTIISKDIAAIRQQIVSDQSN